jgi:glycosyltransferase involved in cell wall biosynthesis
VEKKGFPDLLQACALLREGGHRFRCRIYGEGPMREQLVDLRDRLGLQNTVTFEGPRPHGELVAVFQHADVFVLTPFVAVDGDRDGVPNVLAEAMACGLAVVVTAAGGIPDLVRHEENGLVARPRDVEAIARHLGDLLEDPGRRRELGTAARATVEEDFDVRVAAEQLASLFGGGA